MKRKFLFISVFAFNLFLSAGVALGGYVPMEPIPGTAGGTATISTFPAYVNAVYKFAIWSVGIAALLMISIGGFMYFTAAGNTSKMESGKKIIMDALYGLLATMFAWIILNTINPNLTNIDLNSVKNINTSTSTNSMPLQSSHQSTSTPAGAAPITGTPVVEPDAIDPNAPTNWDTYNPEVIP